MCIGHQLFIKVSVKVNNPSQTIYAVFPHIFDALLSG